MRKILAIAVLAVLLGGGEAQAQAPARSESGFSMALRLGYAIPMGDAGGLATMDDFFGGSVPLWVDVGYRIDRSMFIGAYFQYAFGTVSSTFDNLACVPNGISCSASTLRIGAEFLYKFMPDASFAPWVGIGIGYESTSIDASMAGATGSTSFSGFEFVNLQLGGDFKVSPAFALGPYVALSVAEYSDIEALGGLPFDKKIHQWLQFGVKGTFDM